MLRVAVIVILTAVTACAWNKRHTTYGVSQRNAPLVEASSPGAVLLSNVTDTNLSAAVRLAEGQCQRHGARHAVLVPGSQQGDRATFECRVDAQTVPAAELASRGSAPQRIVARLSQPLKMLVLDLRADVDDGGDRLGVVATSVLLAQLQAVEHLSTVSAADVDALLGFEKMRDFVGCDSTACAAEIGGALGVDLVLYGGITAVGSRYSFAVNVVATSAMSVVARSTSLTPKDEDRLVDAVAPTVADIVAQLVAGNSGG
jgi:hypothetical protein